MGLRDHGQPHLRNRLGNLVMTAELRAGIWVVLPSGRRGVLVERHDHDIWSVKLLGMRGIVQVRAEGLQRRYP